MSQVFKYSRTVFVLDISVSMGGMKCETLHLSATRLIEDIPDKDYAGIVLFDHKTNIEHKVVQITNRSVRDSLIRSVPKMARGATDIGSGLLMGLQALTQESISTEGATIVLVTDGEDNIGGNYVDKVLPSLLNAKVKIVCIAIGNSADKNLERLAKETNGNTYIASDTNREMAARVIEATIQEVKTCKELGEALTLTVCNDLMAINQQSVNKYVIIDPDIGRNTIFTVGSEDIDKLSLSITSPNGHKYDSTSSELVRNQSLKRYQLKLNRSAESGVWSVNFIRHSNKAISATISVTSQPLNPNAIQMRVVLKDADINSQMPPLIFAQICKGNNAVIGAEVMATIDKPDGTQSKIRLNNYNNAYINYFTDYSGSGRYNVSVLARSLEDNCQLKPIRGGIASGNHSVPQFERQVIAGCFKVESFMPSKPLNDQKLQELSLSESLKLLSINCGSFNLTVETPAPRTAKAVIKPAAPKQSDQIKLAKEKLWQLFLEVKKSINFAKISEDEKKAMKTTIEQINSFIISTKSTTIEEVDSYRNKLEDMKQKIK